ncbi:hypothetical protein INR49_032152 [Caranx melampygus]|nr:hypothetical protein INR49_032152 [Caranx melampygus]
MQSLIPSPSALPQMHEEYLREASPEHPELTSPSSAVEQRSDLTASQESITLRETEPVVFSAPEVKP